MCAMPLLLDEYWVWDSWIYDDGEAYHLYFLQAPRALADTGLRHTAATVGHAVSTDLVEWHYLGQTFGPSEDGWDNLAIWTGSVVRGDDGRFYQFYTAINKHAGHVLRDQKVGMAVSDDLHHWTRVGDGPATQADGRWYKTLPEDPNASETWRDPFVFADPDGDGWHMLVTARAKDADRNDDGVIAHARSADLHHWEVGPPLCEPGQGFGQLEVLQIRVIDGRPVLVFTCHPDEMTADRVAKSGEYCTWSVPAEPGDPVTRRWDISRTQPFTAEPHLFAAPLVPDRAGKFVIIGFRNTEKLGVHSFDIIDPIPVTLDANGILVTR